MALTAAQIIYYYYGPGGGAPALFVSSAGSGTEDGSSADNSLPIASLDVSTLANGTTVKLNRGETYDIGEIDITQTGIVFDAYGTGGDPILRGSEDISGLTWTDEGGGVWSTPMVAEPDMLWIGGPCAKIAETARIPILSRGSTTLITIDDADVSGFANIEGSYLVAKDKVFTVSARRTVTDYNAGTGVITVDGEIDVNNNVDLVLYNKFEFFVGNNEWAWEAGELRVKAAASPATLDIRMSAFDYCFKTTANTVFKNLEFAEYYQFGVWSINGVINVNNCSFHDFRDSAVLIEKAVTGANVSDNTIARIGNNGITTRPCANSTFNRNTISEIFTQENYGWQTWVSEGGSITVNDEQVNGCAIAYMIDLDDDTIDGSGCEFNDNVITNTGYNGISLNTGTAYQVLRNTVKGFLGRMIDGGGIYCHHYRAYNEFAENCEIANNICQNQGLSTATFINAGIYLDHMTKGFNLHHNTVSGCDFGGAMNDNSSDHTWEDNRMDGNLNASLMINDQQSGTGVVGTIENLNVNRNVFAGPLCVRISTSHGVNYNPFDENGSADNNYYIRPASTNIYIHGTTFGATTTALTLAQTQAKYGLDAASVYLANESNLVTNETSAEVNGSLEHFSTHSVLFASASTQALNLSTNADIQFESNDPFAIFLRFKRNGNPAGTEVLFSNLGATGIGIQAVMNSTGLIHVELRNTVTTNRYVLESSTGYADNEWHTVLFLKPTVFANSDLIMDGASDIVLEQNNLTQTIVSTEDWFVGNRESVAAHFNGLIDQIAIWGSDQAANVAAILNGGVSQNLALLADPPLHYWEITDGANDAAKFADTGDSGSPLTGAGINAPTISTDVDDTAFLDVDLDPITNYTIAAHYGLIYLEA